MPDPQAAPSSGIWPRVAHRIRVPLGFAFAVFYLWRAKPTWMFVIVGTLVALLGIGVRALASGQVRKNQELTTTGPYAYVRNPLYFGSIVTAIGFAVAACDVWVVVAIFIMFVLIYVPVILGEEEFLRSRFPAYDSYARHVPRLLPHTLRFSRLTAGFSRELYWQHREYNALLGAAGILVALIVKILYFPR